MTILITGSSGLIGAALMASLRSSFDVRQFDIRNSVAEDICRTVPLDGCEGVVHLAAVSRVVAGEHDPVLCEKTNVAALRALYSNALASHRPWVIFASSREVYGNAPTQLVHEDTRLAPENVYARTKVEGERLSNEARAAGLIVNIARMSSVYGSTEDHADRVVPCFARTAAHGGTLRVDGPGNMFDFTHLDDVVRGLHAMILQTRQRHLLPALHFVSGRGVTLGQLAELSEHLARAEVKVVEAPSRSYGVGRFVGDPSRAHALLDWRSTVTIEQGLARLVDDFAAANGMQTGGDAAT